MIYLAKIDLLKMDTEPGLVHQLIRMAEDLGFDQQRFEALFEPPVPNVLPPSEFHHMLQIHRWVLLAFADQQFKPHEQNLLIRCGLSLGRQPEALQCLLQELPKYSNGLIPSIKVIQTFQNYSN